MSLNKGVLSILLKLAMVSFSAMLMCVMCLPLTRSVRLECGVGGGGGGHSGASIKAEEAFRESVDVFVFPLLCCLKTCTLSALMFFD